MRRSDKWTGGILLLAGSLLLAARCSAELSDIDVEETFPFQCDLAPDTGDLRLRFRERNAAVIQKVTFFWDVHPDDEEDIGIYTYLSDADRKIGSYIDLPNSPRKRRVEFCIHCDRGYQKKTCNACWTGRNITAPGPVAEVSIFETTLNQGSVLGYTVTLPTEPNGPINGLKYRSCVTRDKDCDLQSLNRLMRVHIRSTTSPMDKEVHFALGCDTHCLDINDRFCISAFNTVKGQELSGPETCYKRTPLSEGLRLRRVERTRRSLEVAGPTPPTALEEKPTPPTEELHLYNLD